MAFSFTLYEGELLDLCHIMVAVEVVALRNCLLNVLPILMPIIWLMTGNTDWMEGHGSVI